MKTKWNVDDDGTLKVFGMSTLFFFTWFLCLFSFPITLTWKDGTTKVIGYKGWADKLIGKKLVKLRGIK
jgi:hypothetical protein